MKNQVVYKTIYDRDIICNYYYNSEENKCKVQVIIISLKTVYESWVTKEVADVYKHLDDLYCNSPVVIDTELDHYSNDLLLTLCRDRTLNSHIIQLKRQQNDFKMNHLIKEFNTSKLLHLFINGLYVEESHIIISKSDDSSTDHLDLPLWN